jgi:mannose-6-phosphate isomerase-like protein (cupin superfamily)
MPRLIEETTYLTAGEVKPKQIEEYVGRVNSADTDVSVARMVAPENWVGHGQRPSFKEIAVILRGTLRIEHESGELEAHTGQAVIAEPGEWVRYRSPESGGAEYIAVCLPAFSLETVHRSD